MSRKTFEKSHLSRALALAFGASVMLAGAAQAQDTLQRVEVTGSAIKRIAAEGALPVITLSRKDIEQTGATSVRELVQALPSMQGFTTSGESVNGGGGGTTTASLRNMGEIYTLVLLNGRRVAPFNTGSTVNLEQLPLSAIERVEILADGASALYGADAIAGVVNFITKQNTESGQVDINYTAPQGAGGKQSSVSISKGFGNLDNDGFNVFAAVSMDKEGRTLATDREWTKSGVVPFTDRFGNPRYIFATSVNADPPNVELGMGPNADPALDYAFLDLYNPVLVATGKCGVQANSFPRSGACRFDYPATVDLAPQTDRTNLFVNGQVKLGADFRLTGEAFLSDASVKAGYAPPAQPLDLAIGSPLYNKYVLPTLAARGVNPADVGYATYYMRLSDAGQRKDDYQSKGSHFVVGLDGRLGNFDVAGSYTMSKTETAAKTIGGYTSRTKMDALIASGAWDPFAQGTAASAAAIAPAVLNGVDRSSVVSKLDVASLRASGPVWQISSRDVMMAAGADFSKQSYADTPASIFQGPNAKSPNETDFPVGSGNGSLPFDASRNSFGAFSELLVPITKDFEVTGAIRYDSFDAIKNQIVYKDINTLLPAGEQGNKADKSTFKAGFRFQPSRELLLRGSVGTGFRAPTLGNVAAPLAESGVIGTQRDCPVQAGDALFAGCRTVPTQYTLYTGGNPFTGAAGLKPETSDQWTLGARWEPAASMTMGIDLWSVKVSNAITTVPEDAAFDNFATYRGLFSLTTDAATGRQILTFNQVAVNSAVRASQGLDWDFTLRNKLDMGTLTTRFNGTYLFDSYFDLGFGGGRETSLGKLGSDDQVAFKVLTRVSATLDTGMFSNSLTWNWRPGYTDQSYTADDGTIAVRNADGTRGGFVAYEGHEVPAFSTIDWQGVIRPAKGFNITLGVKNLLDKNPPLSVKTVSGNQVGVDSRYHDVIGRTYYISGNYKF